jgi:hypothetical protein
VQALRGILQAIEELWELGRGVGQRAELGDQETQLAEFVRPQPGWLRDPWSGTARVSPLVIVADDVDGRPCRVES